jgi:hypothetical protein
LHWYTIIELINIYYPTSLVPEQGILSPPQYPRLTHRVWLEILYLPLPLPSLTAALTSSTRVYHHPTPNVRTH